MSITISAHADVHANNRARVGIETLVSIVSTESLHVVVDREESKRPFYIRRGDRTKKKRRGIVVSKLFFSWKANYWFVALEDEKRRTIITVHPVHYQPHRRNVSPEDLVQAIARTFPQLTYQKAALI